MLDDERLRRIGERYGKSPAQVAIRWLVQQAGVCTVPKATSREHLAATLDVFDFELTDAEMLAAHQPSKLRTARSILRGLGPF